MNERMKQLIIAVIAGALGGVLMSLLMLYMMIATGFTIWTPGFWLEMVIACMIPQCLSVVSKQIRYYKTAQLVMIAVSMLITMGYAKFAGNTTIAADFISLYDTMVVLSGTLHFSAVVGVIIIAAGRSYMRFRKTVR